MDSQGDRIRRARTRRRMSRTAVEVATGVPVKAQARIESGATQQSKYLDDLLDYYGIVMATPGLDDSGTADAAGGSAGPGGRAVGALMDLNDPPLSRATFVQAWLRVLELWMRDHPENSLSGVQLTTGAPPPVEVVDAMRTITVALDEQPLRAEAAGADAGDVAGSDREPDKPG